MRPTCGIVVEVLVDELRDPKSAIVPVCVCGFSPKLTSLEAFAMSLKAGGGAFKTSFSLMTNSGVDMMIRWVRKRVGREVRGACVDDEDAFSRGGWEKQRRVKSVAN